MAQTAEPNCPFYGRRMLIGLVRPFSLIASSGADCAVLCSHGFVAQACVLAAAGEPVEWSTCGVLKGEIFFELKTDKRARSAAALPK